MTRQRRWPGGSCPRSTVCFAGCLSRGWAGRGKREYVQVLRLMENFRKEEVHEGVREALRLGAISFDAIKHLVLCRIEGRPQRLDLELYPHLPRVNVTTTSAGDYMALMPAGGR